MEAQLENPTNHIKFGQLVIIAILICFLVKKKKTCNCIIPKLMG